VITACVTLATMIVGVFVGLHAALAPLPETPTVPLVAVLMFPYSMLGAIRTDWDGFFLALAVVQFPLYGASFGWAWVRNRLRLIMPALFFVHGSTAALAFFAWHQYVHGYAP